MKTKILLIFAASFLICSARLFSQPAYILYNDSLEKDFVLPLEQCTGQLTPFLSSKVWISDTEYDTYQAGGLVGKVHINDYNFGCTYDTTIESIGRTDVYLASTDMFGSIFWIRRVGGEGNDIVTNFTIDSASNIYIVGYYDKPIMFDRYCLSGYGDNNKDIFIAKYNSSGDLLWAQKIIGKGNDVPIGISLAEDGSGDICLKGTFEEKIQFGNLILKRNKTSNTFIATFYPSGSVKSLELSEK